MAESASPSSATPKETIEIPAQANQQDGGVTPEQWAAMKRVTEKVYAYRERDGHDPSRSVLLPTRLSRPGSRLLNRKQAVP